MTRGEFVWNLLAGLISGPLISGLILLLPLGVLTGIAVVLDPSLAMFEFTPEEELLIPFVLLAVLISTANVRLAVVMSRDERSGRLFEVSTDRYVDDPSGAEHVHGHRGRKFAMELIAFLAERDTDLKESEALDEDYGWGFWIAEKGFSPLWVAIAHERQPNEAERTEAYLVAVTLEPPLMPWRRLTYKPDFALRDRVEGRLIEFLTSRGLSYTMEAEDWFDPEPNTQPAARF